jgi:hypothetical protein
MNLGLAISHACMAAILLVYAPIVAVQGKSEFFSLLALGVINVILTFVNWSHHKAEN